MAQALSEDLRVRIVRAVEGGLSARGAAARFDVSPSTAVKLMQRYRATGSAAPGRVGGYRRRLLAGHEAVLGEITRARPGITLAGVKAALAERGIAAGDLSTVWHALRRLGLTHKKSR